jgi:hypothetical protein
MTFFGATKVADTPAPSPNFDAAEQAIRSPLVDHPR